MASSHHDSTFASGQWRSRSHSGRSARGAAAAFALVAVSWCGIAHAQTNGTWSATGNGTWSTASNWLSTTIASGTNAIANFANVNITTGRNITVDGNYTIGSLNIGDTDNSSTTTTQDVGNFLSGTLTLASTTGAPTINISMAGATGQRRAQISTVIAGTNGLSITQSGSIGGGTNPSVVALKGINTFTGNITIGSGTYTVPAYLDIGNTTTDNAQLGSGNFAGNIDIQGNNFFRIMSVLNNTLSGTILGGTGAKFQLVYGTGTTTLSAANLFAGDLAVLANASQPVLNLGHANAVQSALLTMSGTNALRFTPGIGTFNIGRMGGAGGFALTATDNSAVTLSIGGAGAGVNNILSGTIGGLGGLTKVGSGTLTLSAANTYTGTTAVNAGVLVANNAAALGTTGTVTFGGGTLQYVSGITTDLSSRIRNSGSAISVDTGANTLTWANDLGSTNTGGLTKLGSGTLTLSAANTYTGTTTISAGQLNLSGGNNRLATTAPLTITGGVLDLGSASQTTSGAISFQGGTVQSGTLDNTGNAFDGQAGTVSAVLAGSVGLTKTGAGQLSLTANNTYSGTTTVNNGTLWLGSASNSAIIRGPLVINAGGAVSTGTWSFGFASQANVVPSITINGGVLDLRSNQLGSSPITMTGGVIQGNQAADVYANSDTIVASITTLASSTTATLSAGLALRLNGKDSNQLLFGVASGSAPSGVDLLVSGPITRSVNGLNGGGIAKSGAGRMRLTAANTYTGTTSVNAGILEIGDGSTTGSLSGSTAITGSAGGTLAFNRGDNYGGAFGNTIGGGVGILLRSGTLTLSGTNTYTGGSTISAGRLVVSNSAALGASTSPVAVNAGTLDLGGFSVNVGALSGSAGAVITTANTAGTATLTTSAAADSTFAGTIQDNGSGLVALTKLGSGTLTLTGANTYSGATTISAGRLALSGGDDRLATNAPITITGGVLDLGSAGQSTSGAISFQGGTVQSGTLTSTGGAFDGQAGTVSAILAGGLGLTKTTGGALTLSAANTFAGPTTISAGVLEMGPAGSINSSSGVTLNGATAELKYNSATALTSPLTFTQGTISGTGAIGTLVSVGTGDILSPGNSPGIQAYTAGLEWAPSGRYDWELNALTGAAGTNWDQLAVTGGLDLGGLSAGNPFTLNLITLTAGNVAGLLDEPYVEGESYQFTIATFDTLTVPTGFSTAAGSDLTSLFAINLGGWQGTQPSLSDISVKVSDSGNGIDLVVVPEPAGLALAAIGIAAAAWARRRSHSK